MRRYGFAVLLVTLFALAQQNTNIGGSGPRKTQWGRPPQNFPLAVITSPNPPSISFGTVVAGFDTPSQTVTLRNNGLATLGITSIVATGANAADYNIDATPCGNSLLKATQCIITITFSPDTAGANQTASLVITDNSNGVSGSTQTVDLTGTALQPAPGYCQPPNYCGRTDNATVQLPATIPNMGGLHGETLPGAPATAVGTTFRDTNFNTLISRCTDALSIPGHTNAQVMTIDNNDATKINLNSTLLNVTLPGQITFLISMDPYPTKTDGTANPDYLKCHTTPIGNHGNPPDKFGYFPGTHKNFSHQAFDILFEELNVGKALPQYYKDQIIYQDVTTHASCVQTPDNFAQCQPDHLDRIAPNGTHQSTGTSFSPWIDFQNTSFTDSAGFSSTNCLEPGYQLNWSSSGRFSDDETVFGAAYAGGPPWQASHAYTSGADTSVIIMPTTNNPNNWMFRITSTGTSGAAPGPTWSNFYTAGATVTDGTVQWTALAAANQNEGYIMAVWKIGSGCRIFDLGLRTVKRGDWGNLGALTDGTGTCTLGTTCGSTAPPIAMIAGVTFHEGTQTPNPLYMKVSTNGCGTTGCPAPYAPDYIWETATRNMRALNTNAHGAEGASRQFLGHCYQELNMQDPTTPNDYLFSFFFPENQHGGYQYRLSDQLDTTPALLSTYSATTHTTNDGPWQVEILGLRTNQPKGGTCPNSTVNVNCANGVNCPIRLGSTFNSMSDQDSGVNFVIQENFCTFSMDGTFAACTSDWQKKLGCTNGTASPCSTPSLTRSDVFIFDLRTASQPGGSQPPAVSLSPSPVPNFGTVNVGVTSAAKTVTVTNSGAGTLTLSSPSVIPTGDFQIVNNTCATQVQTGQTCTYGVTFTPTATGARTGTACVQSDSPTTPDCVTLGGTGNVPTGPVASLTPANWDFGAVTVPGPGTAKALTLLNSGDTIMTSIVVSKTGTNASDFTLVNGCGSTLASLASCTITVNCAPAASGGKIATLSVADNAPGTPQTSTLACTGQNPSAGPLTIVPSSYTLYQQTELPLMCEPRPCTYTFNGSALGSTVDSKGNFTAGTTNGTVHVVAHNGANTDQSDITISGTLPTVSGDCSGGFPYPHTGNTPNNCTFQQAETSGTGTRVFNVLIPTGMTVDANTMVFISTGDTGHGVANWCNGSLVAGNELTGWWPMIANMVAHSSFKAILVCFQGPWIFGAAAPDLQASWGLNQLSGWTASQSNSTPITPNDHAAAKNLILILTKQMPVDPRAVFWINDWRFSNPTEMGIMTSELAAGIGVYNDILYEGVDNTETVVSGRFSAGTKIPAPVVPISYISLTSQFGATASPSQNSICGTSSAIPTHPLTADNILTLFDRTDKFGQGGATKFTFGRGTATTMCSGQVNSAGIGLATDLETKCGVNGLFGTNACVWKMVGNSTRGIPYTELLWDGVTNISTTNTPNLDLTNTACKSSSPCNHSAGPKTTVGNGTMSVRINFLRNHKKPF